MASVHAPAPASANAGHPARTCCVPAAAKASADVNINHALSKVSWIRHYDASVYKAIGMLNWTSGRACAVFLAVGTPPSAYPEWVLLRRRCWWVDVVYVRYDVRTTACYSFIQPLSSTSLTMLNLSICNDSYCLVSCIASEIRELPDVAPSAVSSFPRAMSLMCKK